MGTVQHRLRVCVGVLWLIAGALQLQGFMFTRGFSDDVLGTAALSQPAPLADVITFVQHLVGAHPAAWNLVFALLELAIGAGLIGASSLRATRVVCAASIAWGLGVWLVGEGAGGLLTLHAALSTGAPGAALVYCVLTLAAWPANRFTTRILTASWTGVWLIGALLSLLPGQFGAKGLWSQADMGAMMAPSFTLAPNNALAAWFLALPAVGAVVFSLALVGLQLAIGLAVFAAPIWQRRGVQFGIGFSLVGWVFAQGFGGLSTGTATDVGTGPVLALVGIGLLWARAAIEPLSVRARAHSHETNPRFSNDISCARASRGLQLVHEKHVNHDAARVERGVGSSV